MALLPYQMKVDVDQCTSQVFYQAWGDCFTKDLIEEGSPMHLVTNLVSQITKFSDKLGDKFRDPSILVHQKTNLVNNQLR